MWHRSRHHGHSHTTARWGGRAFRRGLGLLVVAGLAWIGGFLWYVGEIPSESARFVDGPAAATDAIVVLTGGSGRVAAGVALLRAGAAKRLLLTGVYPETSLRDILDGVDGATADVACCVDLGHAAQDTPGNAREAAQWMENQQFESLRLVTGNYHMPRSLAAFNDAMPGVTIVAHPVFPDGFARDDWWRQPASAALIASEFIKHLWARLLHVVGVGAP
jgi:uncharacterized SAM-binding protein YcdF (DUF218 family)